LKEISPGISLEGVMLKLKLQYFGHLMRRVDSLEKSLMLGGTGQSDMGTKKDFKLSSSHRHKKSTATYETTSLEKDLKTRQSTSLYQQREKGPC